MARPDNLHQPSNFSPLFWEPSLRLPRTRKDRSASGSHTIPGTLLKYFSELKRGRTRVGLTWLATRHPYAAASIALTLLVIIMLLARLVVNALRALFRGAEKELAGRST